MLLVFWKKAPAPVLLRIPELLRKEFVPPVRKTLDALLKIPALLRYEAAAVCRILLAWVVMPAMPKVPVLLVF